MLAEFPIKQMPVEHKDLQLVDGDDGLISDVRGYREEQLASLGVHGVKGKLISSKVDLRHQREGEDTGVFLPRIQRYPQLDVLKAAHKPNLSLLLQHLRWLRLLLNQVSADPVGKAVEFLVKSL